MRLFHRRQVERCRVRANEDPVYPVSQEDVDDLSNTKLQPRFQGSMPCNLAANMLRNRNSMPLEESQEQAAFNIERNAMRKYIRGFNLFNIAFKVFKDLDLLFFHGSLWENVFLGSMGPGFDGDGIWGITVQKGVHAKRTSILISRYFSRDHERPNKPYHGPDDFHLLLRVLLHEMCHAYMYVHCGAREQRNQPPDDAKSPGHGRYWGRIVSSVQTRINFLKWNVCMNSEGRFPTVLVRPWWEAYPLAWAWQKAQLPRRHRWRPY